MSYDIGPSIHSTRNEQYERRNIVLASVAVPATARVCFECGLIGAHTRQCQVLWREAADAIAHEYAPGGRLNTKDTP